MGDGIEMLSGNGSRGNAPQRAWTGRVRRGSQYGVTCDQVVARSGPLVECPRVEQSLGSVTSQFRIRAAQSWLALRWIISSFAENN